VATWPVDITPVGAVACGAMLWRIRGELHVTVIVKATFDLVHESVAKLVAPDPLTTKDQHHDRSPTRSVERASDLAPYRPRADVVFTGEACAQRPVTSTAVRLAIFRERALLDKTLHVYGDRPAAAAPPRAFQRLPIVYERAFGGPSVDANPVGVGAAGPGGAQPSVLAPGGGRVPAGFGPISRYWPERKHLLGAAHRKGIEARIAEIPDDMRWDYFQAAPRDQQIEFLRGDEWLVLDGLHPTLPRLQTRLPGAQAAAMVHSADAARPSGETAWGPGQELSLAADTLDIDGERQRCAVAWRGSFAVPGGESALARIKIFVGLELPNAAVRWPNVGRLAAPGPLEQEQDTTTTITIEPNRTITLTPEQGAAAAARPPAPFVLLGADPLGTTTTLVPDDAGTPAPPPAARLRPSDIPGAPWASSQAKRPPAPLGEDYATTMFVDLPLPQPPPALRRGVGGPPLEPADDQDETTTLHQARPSRPGSGADPDELEEIDPGDPESERPRR